MRTLEVFFNGDSVDISGKHIGELRLYAPGAKTVTLKGEEIDFARDGDYVRASELRVLWIQLVDERIGIVGTGADQSVKVIFNNFSHRELTGEMYCEYEGEIYKEKFKAPARSSVTVTYTLPMPSVATRNLQARIFCTILTIVPLQLDEWIFISMRTIDNLQEELIKKFVVMKR